MSRRFTIVALFVAVLAGAAFVWPRPTTMPVERLPTAAPPPTAVSPANGAIVFAEIAGELGLRFVHFSGTTALKEQPTGFGSGVATFDFDNDGWLDLYFATSRRLDDAASNDELPLPALYRSRGGAAFDDVTSAAGLAAVHFGQGVAVGDYDNDGDLDLYLLAYGPNALYRNHGDGTFTNVANAAHADHAGWGTGGAFLDGDEDGALDLYVAIYSDWTLAEHPFCGDAAKKVRFYCNPRLIRPARHLYLQNDGAGGFRDRTEHAGLARTDGRGLGVVAADVNRDGRADLYVANDLCPDFLYLGRGDGTFTDVSEASGAAFSASGEAQSGMGVDVADVDRDGWPDLFVTNFHEEYNCLHRNLGGESFSDDTALAGLIVGSLGAVGWGTFLADFDNDGWPDVFVSNGHVDDNLPELGYPDQVYLQPPALWRNQGSGRFALASTDAGEYFRSGWAGRAAAGGDLDNDGDFDLVISHKDGTPAVLRNDSPWRDRGYAFVVLNLVGRTCNRDGIGAEVAVLESQPPIVRQLKGGGSYFAANDSRLLIGIGNAASCRLRIRWPGGGVFELAEIPVATSLTLVQPMPQETTGTRNAR